MTADKSCATCTHANSDMICVNLDSEQCGQAVFERDLCEEWKGESMSEIENAIQILHDSNAKLKQCISQTPSEAYAIDGYETLEKCQAEYDAVELAIQALKEKLDRENPKPLSLEQLREMDGQPIWLDKCYIVNNNYKSPQGWSEPCGVDMWGQGTSLSLIARCSCYDRPPKEQTP